MRNQAPDSGPAPFGAARPASDAPRWRYMTLILEAKRMREDKYNDPLNQLGDQGWEIIAVTPTAMVAQMIYTLKKRID